MTKNQELKSFGSYKFGFHSYSWLKTKTPVTHFKRNEAEGRLGDEQYKDIESKSKSRCEWFK